METAGIDRLSALQLAIEIVRRGGTVSLSGVYGGTADPLNMLQMFDKQLTLRMGQANVRRWIDDILPLLDGRRRPARRRRLRHPPRAAHRGAAGLRDVPEEGGRRVQGGVPAMRIGYFLSCEEFGPAELVEQAVRAEARRLPRRCGSPTTTTRGTTSRATARSCGR